MIIVIEGVDATGKSTLAADIKKEYGGDCVVHHFGVPQKNAILEYGLQLDTLIGDANVFDRFHWGEEVYGPQYRGESSLGKYGFRWIEMALEAQGAVTVLTLGDPRKIVDRLHQLNDPMLIRRTPHVEWMMFQFDLLRGAALTPVVTHNIDSRNQVNVPLLVNNAKARTGTWLTTLGYIGPAKPEVLVVGASTAPPFNRLPFAPLPDSAGLKLFTAIEEAGLYHRARDWGFIDALDSMGDVKSEFVYVWAALGRPKVVALGQAASFGLREVLTPHGLTRYPTSQTNLRKYGLSIAAAAESHTDVRWML